MILIGRKPTLYFVNGYNDMSHFTPSHFGVQNGMGYVTDQKYCDLLEFTNPELKSIPKEIDPGDINPKYGSVMDQLMGTSYAKRVEAALKLNPGLSQLWQFSALQSLDGTRSYIRMVACFGEGDIQTPTWLDINVKLPVLSAVANLLNKAIYFKQKREVAAWNKFLNEKVYSDKRETTLSQ